MFERKNEKGSYSWYEKGNYKVTLAAGTYYISVEGLSTDSTGYYGIYWK